MKHVGINLVAPARALGIQWSSILDFIHPKFWVVKIVSVKVVLNAGGGIQVYDPDLEDYVAELKEVIEKLQQEVEQREGDVLRWSGIAYDLADALCETMTPPDGPKPPICYPPCDCLAHTALDAWGNAQIELLNEVDPGWHERMYNGLSE